MEREGPSPQSGVPGHRIVTARAVVVGLAVTVAVNYWITYSEYLSHSSRMNISQFPLALFAIFAAVVVANGLVRRAWPWVPGWVARRA